MSPAILRLDDLLQEDQEIKESLVGLTSESLWPHADRSEASLAPGIRATRPFSLFFPALMAASFAPTVCSPSSLGGASQQQPVAVCDSNHAAQ